MPLAWGVGPANADKWGGMHFVAIKQHAAQWCAEMSVGGWPARANHKCMSIDVLPAGAATCAPHVTMSNPAALQWPLRSGSHAGR